MKAKTYPDIPSCIHAWANGAPAGKCGNVYFDNGIIYSYGSHFPMAKLATIREDDGTLTEVAFFNPARYSNSTSKHQRWTRGAVDGREEITLPPGLSGYRWDAIQTRADLTAAVAKHAEDETAAREAEKQRKKEAAAAKRALKKAAADPIGYFQTWRDGGALPSGSHLLPVALRLIDDGKTVQTSRGARVPAAVAKKAWPRMRDAVAEHGTGYTVFSAPEFKWGDFTGISIYYTTAEGYVLQVGCHRIPFSEVEEIARRMGLARTPKTSATA